MKKILKKKLGWQGKGFSSPFQTVCTEQRVFIVQEESKVTALT